MSQPIHIKYTVVRLGRQLERLVGEQFSLDAAFDLLAKKSASIEEMVVVEVMREVYLEMHENGMYPIPDSSQADSSTRSARTSAMALSR
jgi:hypothetical protein